MDTFMCSSWYHLRYLSPHYEDGPFDPSEYDYWMPVDTYTGGIEHATMHLIYFRFFTRVLRDLGLLSTDEPATALLVAATYLTVGSAPAAAGHTSLAAGWPGRSSGWPAWATRRRTSP